MNERQSELVQKILYEGCQNERGFKSSRVFLYYLRSLQLGFWRGSRTHRRGSYLSLPALFQNVRRLSQRARGQDQLSGDRFGRRDSTAYEQNRGLRGFGCHHER